MNMLIVGKSGSGKTYFLKNLIRKTVKKDDIAVWISSLPQDIDFSDTITINRTDISYEKLLGAYEHLGVVYGMLTNDEIQEQMDKLALCLWNLSSRIPASKHIYLIIDEAYDYYNKIKHSKQLERLIRAGRKNGISIIMATQQIIDLDLTFLKQCSYLVVFALSESNDLNKVSKNLGIEEETLRSLKVVDHEYIIKNLRTSEILIGHE